jgi:hypothetical protein
MSVQDQIKHFNKRLEALRSERSDFDSHYRELSDNILAARGRFLTTDRNKGHKRNTKQYNNTARRASRSLSAGMMAGMSSPARPWFRLGTHSIALREVGPVKRWLNSVERLMFAIFAESNFYNTLAQVYDELGTFATAPMAIYENFENVIRCQMFTVGSYFLGVNGQGFVDSFYREYQLTVGALVSQFGKENVSKAVRTNFENGNTEQYIDVIHVMEPNDDRDGMRPGPPPMAYRSVYYEKSESEKFLREKGFEEFPIMAPRWQVTAEDTYGTECPGMTALGDIKQLQIQEKKKAQALDKLVDPPLQAPAEMKGKRISIIPGDTSYVDQRGPGTGIAPIYTVNPDFNAIAADIQNTERRINQAYFVDLFLMFTNIEQRERVTQEEIIRKNEEKLLMLGPMLQRTQTELFDKVIDRTFNIALRAGIMPDPPPELENQQLKIEYLSPLFQAQKSVATATIERMSTFVGNVAQFSPEALDKFDADQAIDEYADAIGANPNIILTDDEVLDVRAQRERQNQIDRMAAMAGPAKDGTQAVKNLSDAESGGDSVLDAMSDATRQVAGR